MYTSPRFFKYARVVLIIILLWLFLFSIGRPSFPRFLVEYAHRQISDTRHSLYVLSKTRPEDFDPNQEICCPMNGRWLDLTGFKPLDGFAWGRLRTWWKICHMFINRRSKLKWDEEDWAYTRGVLGGKWVRHVDDLDLGGKNGPSTNQKDWTMDVKGDEGQVMLKFDANTDFEIEFEQEPTTIYSEDELGTIYNYGINYGTALVREVAASMTVLDKSTGEKGLDIHVYGVHWPRIGAFLMTTTSNKFAGIFGLPHLSLGTRSHSGFDAYFKSSQRFLNASIQKTLGEVSRSGTTYPWISGLDAKMDLQKPLPHCEYVVFVLLEPPQSASIEEHTDTHNLSKIEGEMRHLNGTSILRTSKSQFSIVIFSPDCGFVLESKESPANSSSDRQNLVYKEDAEH